MVSTFIGRKHELEIVDNIWATAKPSLFILYGRRRVGKTRLLTHWLQQHEGEGFYWMAEAISALDQLRSFSQALADFETPDMPAPPDLTLPSWEYALRKAARLAEERRMVMFIDEVTYLMDVTPTFIPTLQKVWDHWLSTSNMMLGLSGSQMGLMQKKLLSYDAPLYGRATAHIKLEPLPFGATGRFFPNYTPEERVMIYAIWGGVPAYWERLDSQLPVMENVRRQLLPSNTWMLDESRLLLQDFINDPHNYVGIMRAIAQGEHTFSGIGRRTGMSTGHTSRYLTILRDTGFVARRVPVTDINVPDSRRGRYVVTDPYLRFYYRYVAAYQSKLALGKQEQLIETIEQDLPSLIQASTWPEMCQQWLLLASTQGELPVPVEDVGGEWKRTFAIDVAGISEADKCLVLGMCFWEEDEVGVNKIEDLLAHTRQVIPGGEDQAEWRVYYIGFSAKGWSAEAKAKAEKMVMDSKPTRGRLRWNPAGIRLLDLNQVDADLQEWH